LPAGERRHFRHHFDGGIIFSTRIGDPRADQANDGSGIKAQARRTPVATERTMMNRAFFA
jgi:hypothetical protein